MRGRKRSRTLRTAVAALVLLGLGASAYLAGGFLRFAQEVAGLTPPASTQDADGIVVLTGGSHRIEQAVQLLNRGEGQRLLISGVNPGTGIASLSRLTGSDPALFECCVDLDYDALNTIGNAQMTARWAARHGLHRLILVTSDYHIPRSLLEIGNIEDAPEIVPYPVSPEMLWREDGAPSRLGLKLLASEYAKVLVAKARISLGLDIEKALDLQVAARSAGL